MDKRLARFIGRQMSTDAVEVTDVVPLVGGYSCATARFVATIDGRSHQLVVRASLPPDRAPIVTDRSREWDLLSALSRSQTVPVPRTWFFDCDGKDLGAPAIITDFIEGESLLARADRTSAEDRGALSDQLCRLATTLTAADLRTLPPSVERPSSWGSYIDEQIAQWRLAATEHIEPDPFIEFVASWLARNVPPEAPLTLVHGDFQAPNVMIDEQDDWSLIDWEFGHVGDPREDLGSLQFNELARPPALFNVDPWRFCANYCERTGLTSEIVNPPTVAYFSLLPTGRKLRDILRQVRGLLDGRNESFVSAYAVAILSTLHQHWMGSVAAIESMRASSEMSQR